MTLLDTTARPARGPAATRASRLAADAPAAEALRTGRKATDVAARMLAEAGFTDVDPKKAAVRELGVEFDLVATDASGGRWLVAVAGTFTPSPSGLRRSDVLWRTLAEAAVVHAAGRPEDQVRDAAFIDFDAEVVGVYGECRHRGIFVFQ